MSGLPEQPRYDWTGVLEEECGVGIGGMETCDLPEGHAGFHSADGVPATREGKRGVRARLARFANRHGWLVPFIPGTDGLLWHERRRMAREYERKMNRPISPGARAEMARRLAEGAPVRRMRQHTYTLPASERQRLLRILRGHAAKGDKAAALAVYRLEEMQPVEEAS